MSNFWVVGSLNVDLVVQIDRFPKPGETLTGSAFGTYLGGKGGNQAMALSRLGGAPRVVARVGSDDFGERYRRELAAAGADVTRVRDVANESTGTALIEVAADGQNRIVIVPGANGTLDAASVMPDLAACAAGDILLLQLEIPHETVWHITQEMAARGVTVILDPAPAAPIPPATLAALSWITPNEHEAELITGLDTSTEDGLRRACAALRTAGVSHVAVKAGARGAMVATEEAPEPVLVPGFTVQAVDTTAAGDSFNGGLAWALGTGARPLEAVRTAHAVAALSVTGMGAQTAMPTAAAVTHFMESSS